ncbi:RNA polymerase sigma factor [Clostridium ihumii]|uniref:RNA polymerase sigma factor n=2 Tax=Clostridium ihumii TaxID=1470356 RepID=UPI003D340B54
MEQDLVINLYKKQFKIICLYLVKCGCSISDAEDIVHDSFIKAIEYMDSVEVEKLSSWLFKVAMNNYKNRIKRKKIISFVSINEERFYENIEDECNVENEIVQMEKALEVSKVLNDMKEEYRSLLILKYELQLSYKEISLLLGTEETNVKTYLYRARNKFREEWRALNERNRRNL